MFYCNPCKVVRNWPESGMISLGPCEICGTVTMCFDRPSSTLPEPAKPEATEFPDEKIPLAILAFTAFLSDHEIPLSGLNSAELDALWLLTQEFADELFGVREKILGR